MNIKTAVPVILITSLIISNCRGIDVSKKLVAPLPQNACEPFANPDNPDLTTTIKDLGYVALASADDKTVEYVPHLLIKQMDNIGILPEHRDAYILAVKIHEECVHLSESPNIHMIDPLPIPFDFSSLGDEIIGFKGSEIIIGNKRFTDKTFSELIAMYFMFNSKAIKDTNIDFIGIYGDRIPQYNLAIWAKILSESGTVDFEKAMEYFSIGTLKDNMEGWRIMLGGKDPYDPFNYVSILALLTSAHIEDNPSDARINELVMEYQNPFPRFK